MRFSTASALPAARAGALLGWGSFLSFFACWTVPAVVVRGQHSDYQPHYLVGLLHLPNSNVPEIFKGITSGTYLGQGEYDNWVAHPDVPFSDVPYVGFSDIEPMYVDADTDPPTGGTSGMAGGTMALGRFFCLSDNGYGGSDNSGDYPLNIARVRLETPFAYGHGGHGSSSKSRSRYTEAELMGAAYLHDPNGYIRWENGADIRATYKVPDATWSGLAADRVLTGRDFDPEGLAVLSNGCAIVGDELATAIFAANPTTGEVLSPFVRTPDIDAGSGQFIPDKFLSTVSDKVHCDVGALEEDADQCLQVTSDVVVANGYREHHKSGGYEGFAALPDGSIAAFLEKAVDDEPGVRVYDVDPGTCSPDDPPAFRSFRGFYRFEENASAIADVSAVPGTSRYVLVTERNGYPGLLSVAEFPQYGEGHQFPSPALPANKVCLVDLTDLDDDLVMRNKRCILNLHAVSDPWDVDGDGISRFGLTAVTTEQLAVLDDYCVVVGTDTNYPWTNQLGLNLTELPYGEETMDARFMIVCFDEPIFAADILEDYMSGEGAAGTVENAASLSKAEESAASASFSLTMFRAVVLGVVVVSSLC